MIDIVYIATILTDQCVSSYFGRPATVPCVTKYKSVSKKGNNQVWLKNCFNESVKVIHVASLPITTIIQMNIVFMRKIRAWYQPSTWKQLEKTFTFIICM